MNLGRNRCFWSKNWVREHLDKLDIHRKSTGPEELHLLVLSKQVNTEARLLTIIFKSLWQSRDMLKNCKSKCHPILKKGQ